MSGRIRSLEDLVDGRSGLLEGYEPRPSWQTRLWQWLQTHLTQLWQWLQTHLTQLWQSLQTHLTQQSNLYYRSWRIFLVLIATFFAWTSPYMLAFVHEIPLWYKIVDLVSCVLFFIDICVSILTTTYIDTKTNTVVDGLWNKISTHFSGWSALDLLSVSTPVWPALKVLSSYPNIAKAFCLFRLLQIQYVFSTPSNLETEMHTRINAILRWLKVIFVTVFSIHLTGCAFYLITSLYPHDSSRTWFGAVEAEFEKERRTKLFAYVSSMYWSTTAFSTVGFGDIHPVNGFEMAFGAFSMLFYMGLGVYVLNTVAILLTSDDRAKNFRCNSEALRKFVSLHKLSDQLHQEMYSNLLLKPEVYTTSYLPYNVINLLSKEILLRVKTSVFSPIIEGVYLFRGVSETLQHQLGTEMKIENFQSNDIIIAPEEFPDKFYIRIQGEMGREGLQTSLEICGELAVIFNIPYHFSVRTREASTMLSLNRRRMIEILKANKKDCDLIVSNVLESLASDLTAASLFGEIERKIDRNETDFPLSIKFASQRSNSRLLRHLIKQGDDLEDIYDKGQTILHMAAEREGFESCLYTLLKHSSSSFINKRDASGHPPISYAILRKQHSNLDVFRACRVTLPRDKMQQHYYTAVDADDAELLETVFDFGGDINIVGQDNGTPLHYAIKLKKIAAVKCLLNLKADPRVKDAKGNSALDLASEDMKGLLV